LFTPHGEVWATADTAGAITSSGDHDEFGVGLSGDTTGRYGWLGRQQREADPSGLVLMGVRLYQPNLGRFLTVDPVHGGSATDYDYCNADPVNCYDLDGRAAWRSRLLHLGVSFGVSLVGGAVAGAACAATAGAGCFIFAAAATRMLVGGAGHTLTAGLRGERITWRKTLRWTAGEAVLGGRVGFFKGAYGGTFRFMRTFATGTGRAKLLGQTREFVRRPFWS
jgi:RHS repeat-associated protein